MRQATTGALVFGAAMSALMLPVLSSAKGSIQFEHAMSGVQAVAGASTVELGRLRRQALDLSLIPLGYSATEAAGAMEELARAGFETNEIISATPGVMAAAAAEGMQMARAAEIIGITVRGMGLEATKASHVADVLAYGAARTNESINGFGEAMTYGASQARVMGLSLEETVAAFGVMANFGRKASLAGTSFRQMLVRMINPTKDAVKMYIKMGLSMSDLDTSSHGLVGTLERMRTGMNRLSEADKKMAASVLFGIRGMDAFNALMAAQPGLLAQLIQGMKDAEGAAEEMARIRLNNIVGGFKQLTSAVQTFWNVALAPFQETGANILFKITDKVRSIIFAMQALADGVADPLSAVQDKMNEFENKATRFGAKVWFMDPQTALSVARGIGDGFDWIKGKIKSMLEQFKKVAEFFGVKDMTGDAARNYAKLAVQIVATLAVIGPLVTALSITGFMFGGMTDMIVGTGKVIGWFGVGVGKLTGLLKALKAAWMIEGSSRMLIGGQQFANSTQLLNVTKFQAAIIGVKRLLMTPLRSGTGLLASIPAALVAAIALVAAFLAFRKQGEGVGATLSRLGITIKSIFVGIGSAFGKVFKLFGEFGTQVLGPLNAVAKTVFVYLLDGLSHIVKLILKLFSFTNPFTYWTKLFGPGITLTGILSQVFSDMHDTIVAINKLLRWMARHISDITDKLHDSAFGRFIDRIFPQTEEELVRRTALRNFGNGVEVVQDKPGQAVKRDEEFFRRAELAGVYLNPDWVYAEGSGAKNKAMAQIIAAEMAGAYNKNAKGMEQFRTDMSGKRIYMGDINRTRENDVRRTRVMNALAEDAKNKALSDLLGTDPRYKDRPKLKYEENPLSWAYTHKGATPEQILAQAIRHEDWKTKWNSDEYNPKIIPEGFRENIAKALSEATTPSDSLAIRTYAAKLEAGLDRNRPTPVKTAGDQDSTSVPSEWNFNLESNLDGETFDRSTRRFTLDRSHRGDGNPVYER
jgi:TP901 family phage tail tape measure protein